MDSRMDQYQEHKIEALLEWLGLLRITEENVLERATKYTDNMLIVPVVYNKTVQTVMPKSIVLDPEWFDGNWMKFKD